MQERRAADTLWLQLRDALLAEAREANLGLQHIDIDAARDRGLRLQNGERRLDLQAAREVVTCTISEGLDPDSRKEVPIGLHPGSAPSFRLDGRPQLAEIVAAKLLAALLRRES